MATKGRRGSLSKLEGEERWKHLIPSGKRAQIPLTTEEITELFDAFQLMDANQNGRLEKEELADVLKETGQEQTLDVDSIFDKASAKAKADGLDFSEFLSIVSENSNKGKQVGWMVKSFSDRKTAALAANLSIHHKKKEQDDDALTSFIGKGVRCKNCYKDFLESENHDEACHFHPGPQSSHTGVENYMDRVIFKCCGREQIGTNPVLTKAMPCKTGRHVAPEVYQVQAGSSTSQGN